LIGSKHPTLSPSLPHTNPPHPKPRQNLEKKRYAALEKWTEALESVHGAIVAKTGAASRGGGGGGAVGPSEMPSDPFGSLRDIEGRW
jgi:COP9 signalosome complex subunit 2